MKTDKHKNHCKRMKCKYFLAGNCKLPKGVKYVYHTITFNNGYAVEVMRHCGSIGGTMGLYEILVYDPDMRMVPSIVGNLSLRYLRTKLKEVKQR